MRDIGSLGLDSTFFALFHACNEVFKEKSERI